MTLNMKKTEYTKTAKLFIQHKLETDQRWLSRAIQVIFDHQTRDEQAQEQTSHSNGIGFNGSDAQLMSSFAKQIYRGRQLSERQLHWAKRKMKKYWRQVFTVADREKFNSQLSVWLEEKRAA